MSDQTNLDGLGKCDDCDRTRPLAVVGSGRYCWECLPPEDLGRLLDDVSGE